MEGDKKTFTYIHYLLEKFDQQLTTFCRKKNQKKKVVHYLTEDDTFAGFLTFHKWLLILLFITQAYAFSRKGFVAHSRMFCQNLATFPILAICLFGIIILPYLSTF